MERVKNRDEERFEEDYEFNSIIKVQLDRSMINNVFHLEIHVSFI